MRLTRREMQFLYSSLEPAHNRYVAHLYRELTSTPGWTSFVIPTAPSFVLNSPYPVVSVYNNKGIS